MYNLNTCNIWHSIQLSSCGKCIVYDNSVYTENNVQEKMQALQLEKERLEDELRKVTHMVSGMLFWNNFWLY